MCEKCQELDDKIARYWNIRDKVPDTQLAEGINKLIGEAEAEKAALHREEAQSKSKPV